METNKNFICGVYGDQDELLAGIKGVREAGVKISEVYSPFPVHHIDDALGNKESLMPFAAFFFGLLGTICAITMQVGMIGLDWPMIIGGKPNISIADFVPITFELTVLMASFGMVITFFISANLKPWKAPRIFDRRSTDDKHIMAIDLDNNSSKTLSELTSILAANKSEESFVKNFATSEDEESFIKYAVDLFTNGVTTSSRELN